MRRISGEVYCFSFWWKALIGEAGHQLREHVGSGGIAAAVEVSASDEKQGLGDMAFSGAGVSCNDKPLLTPDKVQFRDLQDLCFVHPGLEAKVEVRKELSIRKPGLLDSSLDPSFDPGVCLDGQQPSPGVRWGEAPVGRHRQVPGQGPSVFPEASGSSDVA